MSEELYLQFAVRKQRCAAGVCYFPASWFQGDSAVKLAGSCWGQWVHKTPVFLVSLKTGRVTPPTVATARTNHIRFRCLRLTSSSKFSTRSRPETGSYSFENKWHKRRLNKRLVSRCLYTLQYVVISKNLTNKCDRYTPGDQRRLHELLTYLIKDD